MKKIIIRNTLGEVLQTAIFKDQDSLNIFKEVLEKGEAWGKPEHQKELTPRIKIWIETKPVGDELDEHGFPIEPAEGYFQVTEATYETIPSEYMLEELDITLEVASEKVINDKILMGKKAREACNDCYNLIVGYNLDRNLSSEQVTEMQSTLNNISIALMAVRPPTAKFLISQLVPDGILVTNEMKAQALKILADY